jgi:hypothetical protein
MAVNDVNMVLVGDTFVGRLRFPTGFVAKSLL